MTIKLLVTPMMAAAAHKGKGAQDEGRFLAQKGKKCRNFRHNRHNNVPQCAGILLYLIGGKYWFSCLFVLARHFWRRNMRACLWRGG